MTLHLTEREAMCLKLYVKDFGWAGVAIAVATNALEAETAWRKKLPPSSEDRSDLRDETRRASNVNDWEEFALANGLVVTTEGE